MKDNYTRKEVEILVNRAFWAGVDEGGVEYAGDAWLPGEFIDQNEDSK